MKSKNLLLFAGIPLLVLLIYGIVHSRGRQVPDDFLTLEHRKRHQESNEILKTSEKHTPLEIYQALITVARETDADILPLVKQLSASSSETVRAAAAYSLSMQNDPDSVARIERLSHSDSPLIRSHLIHAAMQDPGPKRQGTLKNILQTGNITDAEKAEALAALMLSEPDKEKAHETFETMVKDASDDGEYQASFVQQLNETAPRAPEVLSLDRKILSNSKDPLLLSLAIKNLAADHDPQLEKNFAKWARHPSELVRKAAIEGLPPLCPPHIWGLIKEGYEKETQFSGRSLWLLAAFRLNGPEAKKFLESANEKALKNKWDNESRSILDLIKKLEEKPRSEKCVADET